MDRNECVKVLKELLDQIEHFSAIEKELQAARESLTLLRKKPLSAVSKFDTEKKNEYIESRIGCAPAKPKGAIKLAIPVYLSKKKAYEKEYADYMIRFQDAEKAYYVEFKDIREKLEAKEKASVAFEIQQAEQIVSRLEGDYQLAKTALKDNETVSTRLKNKTIIATLIEYFQDHRADSIKEAINLYFEEEHRKHLETYSEEQVRLTAEAAEQARLAAVRANEVAERVEEAIRRADDALTKAEEAYGRANDAYSEAQSAYWAATSKNN